MRLGDLGSKAVKDLSVYIGWCWTQMPQACNTGMAWFVVCFHACISQTFVSETTAWIGRNLTPRPRFLSHYPSQ